MKRSDQERWHFIGIGGTGMAPLAEYCLRSGISVSGSDVDTSSRSCKKLIELGAQIAEGHSSANLVDVTKVVFSTAIPKSNEELIAAKDKGITIQHRAELLAELTQGKRLITVAGTHGKTTTSALIVYLLDHLGEDPSAVIGGTMNAYSSGARHGKSEIFVAEADESDGSFIRYQPEIALVTNIEEDHLDFHGDEEHLAKSFAEYLDRLPEEGWAILGWDNAATRNLGQNFSGYKLAFGTWIGSDVRALNYRDLPGGCSFDAVVERDLIPVKLNLIGRHNALNALAALAVIRALELDVNKAVGALAKFPGVHRRLTTLRSENNLTVLDDYAHNPGKIRAVLAAVRASNPEAKLHVIFQPHRFSRIRASFDEFAGSFYQADRVYVAPVYAAGEDIDSNLSNAIIARAITRDSKIIASSFANSQEMVQLMRSDLVFPSIVLTLGAGDVWKLADDVAREFFEKED